MGRAHSACNLEGSCCSDGGSEPRLAVRDRRTQSSRNGGERESGRERTHDHAQCPALLAPASLFDDIHALCMFNVSGRKNAT